MADTVDTAVTAAPHSTVRSMMFVCLKRPAVLCPLVFAVSYFVCHFRVLVTEKSRSATESSSSFHGFLFAQF